MIYEQYELISVYARKKIAFIIMCNVKMTVTDINYLQQEELKMNIRDSMREGNNVCIFHINVLNDVSGWKLFLLK